MSAASTASAFPERVGKYELLLPLGTGGTATVYLARTRGVAGFEREVALKLVHAHLRGDEESRLHLLEEARLAARIRHPNVVPVTEVDADACGVFLVMDYVEGEALSGLVRLVRDRGQRLPPRLIARIMNDSLAGLHAAHEMRDPQGELVGLVHRDFSPQNILVGIEGVARLADFGVAKAASRTVRTKTGLVKGKVAYMSPEQARGHKVDRRCDVWAAGVVVWELITGRKLYDHEDDVATLLSVVTEEPPRLSKVMQGVPHALDEAVAYALTSDVVNRCPSAETLRCMLESAWDECGGMATTTELGVFVRQTVGHKLAERRSLVARGRLDTNPAMASAAMFAGAGLSLSSGPGHAPEDGTKTAISAAVPATEQLGAGRYGWVFRRSSAVGAMLAASVIGAAVLGLAVAKPDEEGTTAATPPGQVSLRDKAESGPEVGTAGRHKALIDPDSEERLAKSDTAKSEPVVLQEASTAEQAEEAAAAPPAASNRSLRRASSTKTKSATSRSGAKSRASTQRAKANSSVKSPTRVLPLPPERQQRSRPRTEEAPPPNLAPDPYSNR